VLPNRLVTLSLVVWGWNALHETKEEDDAYAPDCACVKLDAGYVDERSYRIDEVGEDVGCGAHVAWFVGVSDYYMQNVACIGVPETTFGFVDQQLPGSVPAISQCFVYGVHSPKRMMVGKIKFKPMCTTTENQISALKPFEKLSMKMYAQMLSFTSAMP
jgi:hypothetical protein